MNCQRAIKIKYADFKNKQKSLCRNKAQGFVCLHDDQPNKTHRPNGIIYRVDKSNTKSLDNPRNYNQATMTT